MPSTVNTIWKVAPWCHEYTATTFMWWRAHHHELYGPTNPPFLLHHLCVHCPQPARQNIKICIWALRTVNTTWKVAPWCHEYTATTLWWRAHHHELYRPTYPPFLLHHSKLQLTSIIITWAPESTKTSCKKLGYLHVYEIYFKSSEHMLTAYLVTLLQNFCNSRHQRLSKFSTAASIRNYP